MKRKAAAQSSHLSFSQFTQKQQNVSSHDNMGVMSGYGSLQQSSGQTYPQQQSYQQHSLHHQPNVHQPHAYQQPGAQNHNFETVAGSSNLAGGLYAASNPDQAAQNEWKMKMVSETKIVLKKFNPPSGGKPSSYKHPRKRHL